MANAKRASSISGVRVWGYHCPMPEMNNFFPNLIIELLAARERAFQLLAFIGHGCWYFFSTLSIEILFSVLGRCFFRVRNYSLDLELIFLFQVLTFLSNLEYEFQGFYGIAKGWVGGVSAESYKKYKYVILFFEHYYRSRVVLRTFKANMSAQKVINTLILLRVKWLYGK